jgi:hypothetical protein
MRKPLALLLVAALAIPVFSGSAVAAKKKGQSVEGSVVLPQGGGPAGPCVYRTQRTVMGTTGAPNGVFGYSFEVDPKTANKKFTLKVSDGIGMDIQFYTDLGDPSDPTAAPANVGFETAGPGGESGTVPKGYPIAFVCMTEGFEGNFTYTAG